MSLTKQFNQLDPINNGTSAANNFKLSDSIPAQHSDVAGGVNKLVKRTFAQMLCEPVAVSDSNNPDNGAYTATCKNYPDFAVNYQDEQMSTHYYVGLKVRVIFNYGITFGSVSDGTYPTLNINSSGALPLLAQGKTMAAGAASKGQSLELTLIPYGNGYAWDADSNVRESTSDYTIYTDGVITYQVGIRRLQTNVYTNDTNGRYLTIKTSNTNIPYYQRFLYFVSNSDGYFSILLVGQTDGGYVVQSRNLVGNLLESASYIDVDGYVGIKIKVASGWSTLNEVEAITGTLLSISRPSLT